MGLNLILFLSSLVITEGINHWNHNETEDQIENEMIEERRRLDLNPIIGEVSLLASGISFDGISMHPSETYVMLAAFERIHKVVISTATITTPIGVTPGGYIDGVGTNTKFNLARNLCFSTDGNSLYIGETGGGRVRIVTLSTLQVSTLVGGTTTGNTNGIGTSATFINPYGIAASLDSKFIVVADYGGCRIRHIVLSTLAVSTLIGGGCGITDGYGTNAKLNLPHGVVLSKDDSLLYISGYSDTLIRKVIMSTLQVITMAGRGNTGGYANGIGTNALFNAPYALKLSFDESYLIVCDGYNKALRKVTVSTNEVTTIAGSGSSGSTNGFGTNAGFTQPMGIAMSLNGDYGFVADQGNNQIRKVKFHSIASLAPSSKPSSSPTFSPTISFKPTPTPSMGPSISPTSSPTLSPTNNPTDQPTTGRPSGQPTGQPSSQPSGYPTGEPTGQPTGSPSCPPTPSYILSSMTCPPFSRSHTDSARSNTVLCWFELCPFQYASFSICPSGSCSADTMIRLKDTNGVELEWDESGICGFPSDVRYDYNFSGVWCQKYVVHQGCVGDSSCSGEIRIRIHQSSSKVSRYSVGALYNNNTNLDPTFGVILSYQHDAIEGLVIPKSGSIDASRIAPTTSPTASLPPPGWILVRWRPVLIDLATRKIKIDHWEGSVFVQGEVITYWIVNRSTRGLVGFLTQESQSNDDRVYYLDDSSGVLQISQNSALTSSSASSQYSKGFVPQLSDRRLYFIQCT